MKGFFLLVGLLILVGISVLAFSVGARLITSQDDMQVLMGFAIVIGLVSGWVTLLFRMARRLERFIQGLSKEFDG